MINPSSSVTKLNSTDGQKKQKGGVKGESTVLKTIGGKGSKGEGMVYETIHGEGRGWCTKLSTGMGGREMNDKEFMIAGNSDHRAITCHFPHSIKR